MLKLIVGIPRKCGKAILRCFLIILVGLVYGDQMDRSPEVVLLPTTLSFLRSGWKTD